MTVRQNLVDRIWRGADPLPTGPRPPSSIDLQGWNSKHRFLTDLIAADRPKIIIEVGVWKGGSVVTMAKELQSLGLDSAVIAVDTWRGSWEHWLNPKYFPLLAIKDGVPSIGQQFYDNVVASGLREYVVPLPLDSANATIVLQRMNIVPDMIHLDAGHDYQAVLNDLRNWWPLLAPGGLFVGDDYYIDGGWPGVRQAFDEFFGALGLAPFEFEGGKARIRKPA